MTRFTNALGVVLMAALLSLTMPQFGSAQAPQAVTDTLVSESCGALENHYGPYDYRTRKDRLTVVEKHHFTPVVEALIRGQEGYLGGDLSYVLATFPNHHRALVAIVKFGARAKSPQPPHLTYSIECYFLRALQFQRDDIVVRMLYAQYIGTQGRQPEAIEQLAIVERLAADNAFSIYNAGLVYFEIGAFDRALAAAHKARELGFERPDLEAWLRRDGRWQDPVPAKQ